MDKKFTNEFSEEIWRTTYKDVSDTTVDDTFRRVAKAVASAEQGQTLQNKWEAEFYELLSTFKFTVGGRIYSNAGTAWQGTTLMNCFVGPKPKRDQDSLTGILTVLQTQAHTLKSEGGWGMNFSFIRPRGSFIHGIGVESPGSVKYMELFDASSDIITAGSGKKSKNKDAKGKIRKGAMMGVMDVWHPDIEEFITAKLTAGRLSKFNISVNCSNEFMDRVSRIIAIKKTQQEDCGDMEYENLNQELNDLEKWDLIFPDTKYTNYKAEWDGNITKWKSKGYPVVVHKTVNTLDLWNLVIQSTYNRNDPGVLFLDNANRTHCWYYGEDSHIAATNPCGEQCLPFGGVCNLASINLTQFVDVKNRRFDLEAIKKAVPIAVRFLDDVNDYTNAPLPEYVESIRERRRIGLGVLGWGSALYLLNVRFGSDEAEAIKDDLMRTITHTAIEASIDLAKEKGMFPACDPAKHIESPYWKQIALPVHLIAKMGKYGIRNSALFSIQPTGNTSIFANIVSGGLEPVFLHEYIRTSIVPHCPTHIFDVTPKYWEGEFKETELFKFTKEGDETILRGVDIDGTVYKIDKNRGLTKETLCEDYAVRYLKSINEWDKNAPWAVTTNDLSVEDHVRDMTGFGKWIDSSMSKTVNVPNDYPFEKFQDVYLGAYKTGFLKGITTYRAGTMTNVLASTEKKEESLEQVIPDVKPPKRPKSLTAELHHFIIKKHRYYAAVGLMGGKPYEIFTGINHNDDGDIYIPKAVKDGTIAKLQRGDYTFDTAEGETYKLTNGHADDTADALTRTISAALRHGCDIQFIVHQLEKTRGPLTSFTKVLARALKKHIKDGSEVKGEECPSCNQATLVRREGCKACNCGYTACG